MNSLLVYQLLHEMLERESERHLSLVIFECNNEVSKLQKLISEAFIKAVFVELNEIRFFYQYLL